VEIFFSTPGLKDKVLFASGKVSDVGREFVTIKFENKKSAVVPGLTARIKCTPQRVLLCTFLRKSRMTLVLVRDDGVEVKQLPAKNLAGCRFASWSPDGKQIVCSTADGNGPGLFLMDASGENVKRLTHGNDSGAAFSPDGKTIAFTRYGRGGGQIMSIRVDSKASEKPNAAGDNLPAMKDVITRLTDGSNYDADLAWSPEGKDIVFASDRSGFFRLYLMAPDGKNVRELTKIDNTGGNAYPAWSPDGKRIAFTNSAPDGTRQIFIVDRDGKNTNQLTKVGVFNCYAAWSPDGKKLAYMSFAETKSKGSLALMKPDGSEQKIVGRDQGAGHNGRPSWKPKAD
jgi:TolB protein